MSARKTIRLLAALAAIVTLVAFTIVVSSAIHHHASAEDSHCPYCHMAHQSSVQPESGQSVTVLSPQACLPLPEDIIASASQVFPHTSTRAPPLVA